MVQRCQWIEGKPSYYVDYHDYVWGKPEHDDQKLFQWLSLELFHIGLSWQLVLSKKDNFLKAFDQFDIARVASYGQEDIDRLVKDEGIIRHAGKIKATINNAQVTLQIQEEFGSFDAYIWNFTEGETLVNEEGNQPSQSPLSDQVAKDLKRRGMKFIGSVTIYSYLQAIGVINDHDMDCDFR